MRALVIALVSCSACHLIGGAGDYVVREGEGGAAQGGGAAGGTAGAGGDAGGGGTGGQECTPNVDCPTAWLTTFGNGLEPVVVTDAGAAGGHVAVVGRFEQAVDFGDGRPLETLGDKRSAFVASYDSAGSLRWARAFGNGLHDQHAEAVATDASGVTVVVGRYKEPVDFGDGELPSPAKYSIFVAKYDSGGGLTWVRTVGNAAEDQHASDVAIDPSGDVIVVGRFREMVDFGGGAIGSGGAKHAAYVVRYDAAGAFEWVKTLGNGMHDQFAEGVAVDGRGDIAVVGRFKEPIDFGAGAVASHGAKYDAFVAKYRADGSFAWVKQFGNGAHDQHAEAVASDGSGAVVAVGRFKATIDFGAGDVTPMGMAYHGYIAKLDLGGGLISVRTFGDGVSDQHVQAVTVDPNDNVVAAGRMTGAVDFGAGTLMSPGSGYAAFAAAYSPLDSALWASVYGAGDGEAQAAGTAAADGGVLVAGVFHGTAADFGLGSTIASHDVAIDDGFLLMLTP
jgi:hypothetical protein